MVWVATVAACDGDSAPTGPCGGQECSVPESREELLAELEGFADPMAEALRALADEDGRIPADWRAVSDALGDAVGCDASTERSFVVLSNEALRPKGLVTRCSDSPSDGSRFFMVIEPGEGDLDGENFRVAAWDAQREEYHRYQMVPTDGGGLGVSVEPTFCAGCHGGTAGRTDWVPIMNEMTEPWAQWNAEPGFSSFLFDEYFPEDARGPVFESVTESERLDSASNLEPLIRSGFDRVAGSRIKARDQEADLAVASDLLRPVFCDETANFVSEIHRSGEIELDAVLDPGLRAGFAALGVAQWPFVTDATTRIGAPTDDEEPVALVAVRGQMAVQGASSLRSRGVLEPHELLRVRALDWQRPFGSSLRCDLFEDALARVESGEADLDVAALPDNTALVRALYDEAMHYGGTPLSPADPDALVVIDDFSDSQAAAALEAGDLGGFELTVDAFGERIDSYLESLGDGGGRVWLAAERDRRGCIARSDFPTAPLIPDLPACA